MEGKTIDQIVELVVAGEVTEKAAAKFVADRATAKLTKKLAARKS